MMMLPSHGQGWVEVICGPMFSGKTEELIRRVRRAKFAKQRVLVFKPLIDNRFAVEKVVSHSEQEYQARPLNYSYEVFDSGAMNESPKVVAFDEAQFFDPDLIEVVDRLAAQGRRVIVAGLDLDSNALPFGPMPQVMARAEYITKLQSVCMGCGEPGSRTFRTVESTEQVVIGGSESYKTLCRPCYLSATSSRL